jgi:hypothetical protein
MLTTTEGRMLVLTHEGLRFIEDARYSPELFSQEEAEAMRAKLQRQFPSLPIKAEEYKP